MRSGWMIGAAMCTAALAAAAGAEAGGNGEGGAQTVRRVQTAGPSANLFDEATGLAFTSAIEADGTPVNEVRGPELSIRRKLKAGGVVSLDLTAGSDSVSITVRRQLVEVQVGRRRLRFDPTRATESQYLAVRKLLAQTRATSRLRTAASGLGPAARHSAQGFGLLLSEALVALLEGDPSPVLRLQDQMRAETQGVALQGARRAIGDCYNGYRREVYFAMLDAERCVNDFAVWNVPMRNLCMLDWTIRVEAAWWEFMSCSFGAAIHAR